MSKKNKDINMMDIASLNDRTLELLEGQKQATKTLTDAYRKIEDTLNVDLFSFIYLANEHLLKIVDKTIDIFKKANKK